MKHTLPKPTTCKEAVRAVCFINDWSQGDLAKAMGSAESYVSELRTGVKLGTFKMLARILEQAKDVEWL